MNDLNSNSIIDQKGKLVLLFTACLLAALKYIFPEHHVLSWDVFGYYLYLPAKFIYHDPYLLHQEWLNEIVGKYESTATLYQINQYPETGNWIIKYSMGMSILYAPFFFVAHWLAPILGYQQDGFSAIYSACIEAGMFLFSIIGLYYFLKLLYQFTEKKIALITFLLVVFATNYVQLSVQYSLLTHVPLFSLYAILIYHTIKWHESFSVKLLYIISICCGLITLIRPNEIVCVFIPMLWRINQAGHFMRVIQVFKKLPIASIGALVLFMFPFFMQMYYWKCGTGSWLYYSYQNPGEGFDFLSPYTYQFLFSFRKGWLIYTPLAIAAIISLIEVYKKQRYLFLSIVVTIVVSVYIVSSWSCWWYAGGSYSQRAILSVYPLLGISLSLGLQFLFNRFGKAAIIPFAGMLLLNLFQAWQFQQDILDHERMTFAYYKKIFLQNKRPADADKYLLVNRSADDQEAMIDIDHYKENTLLKNTFPTPPKGKEYAYCDTLGKGDKSSIFMNETNEFLNAISSSYHAVTTADHFWIKVSADVFIPNDYSTSSPRIVVHFNHGKNGTYKYRNKWLAHDALKINTWNRIDYLYLTPEVRSVNDTFSVYLWHPDKEKVFIDNLTVSVLTPKQQ
ncbi:MAG: hypothetical protein ACK46R_04230 [Bacteroidota bacterium]